MTTATVDSEFYERRSLPVPEREWRPEGIEALRDLIVDGESADLARVVLGGGQHVAASSIGERSVEVVRTDRCDEIGPLDDESGTICVEAGVEWGELRDRLADDGFGLDIYGLQPADATIGGLLGRRRPVEGAFTDNDLRANCVGLSAVSPGRDDYTYLAAPRKAAGPDLRHLYLGAEGAFGVILQATLVVSPLMPGRHWSLEAEGLGEVVEALRTFHRLEVRPNWCRWSNGEGRLEAAAFGPNRIVDAWDRRLNQQWGGRLETGDREVARGRRAELEADHPGRRGADGAEAVVRLQWPLDAATEAVAEWDAHLSDVVVHGTGPRQVTTYLVGDEPVDSWFRREKARREALSIRRIVGGRRQGWPEWAQKLKRELDPDGVLAVGP